MNTEKYIENIEKQQAKIRQDIEATLKEVSEIENLIEHLQEEIENLETEMTKNWQNSDPETEQKLAGKVTVLRFRVRGAQQALADKNQLIADLTC